MSAVLFLCFCDFVPYISWDCVASRNSSKFVRAYAPFFHFVLMAVGVACSQVTALVSQVGRLGV